MTIALSPVTVANSISELSIAGVNIKSLEGMPTTGNMLLPLLMPQPDNFITDIVPVRQSFGSGTGKALDFNYTLHYVFLFTELGSGISQLDPYSPLIEKLEVIWETILTNDAITGLVDMELAGVEGLGAVQGPDSNQYWGALFSLRCLEHAQ